MKQFNILLCAIFLLGSTVNAQLCTGDKGPNLLGAKGTFSPPYITVNTKAALCMTNGANEYSMPGNIGNALTPCNNVSGNLIPCSDYIYSDKVNGMKDEFTYTLIKNIGNKTGSNCIHPLKLWRGKDHTGDDGYFLAVNGAPNTTKSPVFYSIKNIPVCVGTTYEFSAWVISLVPGKDGTTDSYSPDISFKVNGKVIANSGKIPYNENGDWVQVGGRFTATTSFVDLEVVNATAVGSGNDLGLDDISIQVCQSQIKVNGPSVVVEGSSPMPKFVVSDPLVQNTWYKWQLSTDGGITFTDETAGSVATFDPVTKTYEVSPANLIGEVDIRMNGFYYQLVVSTSKEGLSSPDCIFVNSYHIKVQEQGVLPVNLTTFTGSYEKGATQLKWSTAQEQNSDRFEVYRSVDGTNFTFVGEQKAAGNSQMAQNYAHADAVSGVSGTLFYKLKLIDLDGKYAFSKVIQVNVLEGGSTSLQVFPNPVVNSFKVQFYAPAAQRADLLIRNASGQLVYSQKMDVVKGENSQTIANAGLSRGMYYITVSGDNLRYKASFQKQ